MNCVVQQKLTVFTGMQDEVFPLNLVLKYVRGAWSGIAVTALCYYSDSPRIDSR